MLLAGKNQENKFIMRGYFILFSILSMTVSASDRLLKEANERIALEYSSLNPFWTNTMIPIIVFLAIILLLVSIFAVSLIAIKALNEPEPSFATFAPPGFDALWERNIQAELDLKHKKTLETIVEVDEIESEPSIKQNKESDSITKVQIPSIKFMKMDIERANYPATIPKPAICTNSKSGLE